MLSLKEPPQAEPRIRSDKDANAALVEVVFHDRRVGQIRDINVTLQIVCACGESMPKA